MVASPAGRDLSALRALGRFCAAQGLEVALAPEVVEAFVVAGLHGRAPWTKGTYRSTLRSMAGRPRPALATPFPASPALAPYTSAEVAELASIAAAQPSAYGRPRPFASWPWASGRGSGRASSLALSARTSPADEAASRSRPPGGLCPSPGASQTCLPAQHDRLARATPSVPAVRARVARTW